jgi:heme exporter protein CcmD
MDFSAPHMGFIVASYALSALLICGLTIYILVKDRRLRAEAERLDKQRRKGGA